MYLQRLDPKNCKQNVAGGVDCSASPCATQYGASEGQGIAGYSIVVEQLRRENLQKLQISPCTAFCSWKATSGSNSVAS